jgi:two-component system cell cycle sensor histidine kinase/response regulator CckA
MRLIRAITSGCPFAITAPGIKKAYLKKVFDPYYHHKAEGQRAGAGSGLQHRIARHDGQLTVESTPEEGTAFTLFLPASHLNQVSGAHSPEELITGSGRILVMDDEDFIRELASAMLRKMGYDVVLAKDGQQAVALYQTAFETRKSFDAVILDLTVPGGMGGKEAIGRLSAIDPKVRAIVSSGYSNDPVMANHAKYGFSGAVKKPYLAQEMSRVLNTVIQE